MDVIIEKQEGGLGRAFPSNDSTSAIVAERAAIVGGVQEVTPYLLGSIEDAEALLITEASDKTDFILLWHAINDFFRMSPGAKLWIAISPDPMPDSLIDGWQVIKDAAKGEVRQLAFVSAFTAQEPDDVATLERVAEAQTIADLQELEKQPLDIFVEASLFPAGGLSDMRVLNSKNIHPIVAQNKELAEIEDPATVFPFRQKSMVGLALGTCALAAVNENIGWVREFNLLGGDLATASVTHTSISHDVNTLSQVFMDDMDDNGYIFIKPYVQKAGLYFNDSHSATEIVSDYAYLENNRTIDKASRLIYQALLPFVGSPILVDPETGQISGAVAKGFELTGRRALDQMFTDVEISGAKVIVDPEQDILSTSELIIEFEIIPTGTARTIKAKIGFSNPVIA